MAVQTVQELVVYRKGYRLAMAIFAVSKRFPMEESYALTTQIRRSSRSVCLNLREAWGKRCYAAHFVSKLTDCDGEANETACSIDFAKDCGYITVQEHADLAEQCVQVGRMIGSMILNPRPFLLPRKRIARSPEES
jgi:four helix bundle protein